MRIEIETEEIQPGDLIDRVRDAVGPLVGELLPYVVVLVIAAVVLYLVWRLLKRRRGRLPLVEPDLTIDVASLGTAGPPPGGPVLEHHNLPMRLAAIVVAPAGRARRAIYPGQLR